MRINFLVLFCILTFSTLSLAQVDRLQFNEVPKGKQMDLLQEGSSIKVNQEASVQEANPPSSLFITFLAGAFQPTSLDAESNGNSVHYPFSTFTPLASVQFSNWLWRKSYGVWGWSGSIGYSYSQYQDITQTALHIIPVTMSLSYRAELKNTQKIIPYFMAGPQLWTYFQRGLDQYNTSQSSLFGAATAGVAFNLNRMHILSSRNDTEVVIQYQRTVGPSGTNSNFNGDTIQIGGTIAL